MLDKGNGLLFGNISGVPPVEVVVIGAGTVGEFAARSAIGLGANVKVFDSSITRLAKLQNNLGRTFIYIHHSAKKPNESICDDVTLPLVQFEEITDPLLSLPKQWLKI